MYVCLLRLLPSVYRELYLSIYGQNAYVDISASDYRIYDILDVPLFISIVAYKCEFHNWTHSHFITSVSNSV